MISFSDGPAKGQGLYLERTPVFLRVVQDTRTLKWDALDQFEDTMRAHEVAFVYRIEDKPSRALVCSRSGPRGCNIVTWATYRHVANQPAQAVLRDNARWRQWTESQTP